MTKNSDDLLEFIRKRCDSTFEQWATLGLIEPEHLDFLAQIIHMIKDHQDARQRHR